MVEVQANAQLDVLGKQCPEPNMMIKSKLDTMNSGDILEVIGDATNRRSIERFIKMRGHETINVTEEGDKFRLYLKKAEKEIGKNEIRLLLTESQKNLETPQQQRYWAERILDQYHILRLDS